ncbi:hypothetical protein POM88_049158 [Heracleum sosnowskyi]|uniref:DUF4378 domain-containing protein n=1 Tax=Heracleum sosnowskyi TaxID=360622 RepID=A0AAD8GX95_9APIA|nr:hypothetical protein POM88_049158 [Heracleum sosnowskyi]
MFFLVHKILSAAGFNNVLEPDTLFPSWHSHGSPLDPSLRDQYLDLNDKETQHETKKRQRRSTQFQKLVFYCVNAVLKNLGAEPVVRKEVVRKGWVEDLKIERVDLRKEIENKVLEELVQEAVVELIVRLCWAFNLSYNFHSV